MQTQSQSAWTSGIQRWLFLLFFKQRQNFPPTCEQSDYAVFSWIHWAHLSTCMLQTKFLAKNPPTQDLRTPCFSGLLERIVFPNTAQGRKHCVTLHSSQNKEWPLLALTPVCAPQAWTPANPSAIYRCKRGSGDTSGSQSFPTKSRIEKCARQQNYKSLSHNFSRKHLALTGTTSTCPCYANLVTCKHWSTLDREGHCQKISPSTFVFVAATSGEEITAKHLPLGRALLGSILEAEMQTPYALLKL